MPLQNTDNLTAYQPKRSTYQAMRHGAFFRCPSCGKGSLFKSYLKVQDNCSHCKEELHHHRADDAPPYFTIFIVGHIILPLLLAVEATWVPPLWIHVALWLPLTLILSLSLLPVIKGMIVGLQWALFMHGFSKTPDKTDQPDY